VRGAERTRGAISYLSILALLHEELRPAHYLEIGVRDGRSLALAGGPATGVDPAPSIKYVLPAKTEIVQMTSDAFFAQAAAHFAPDFCLIDGMHLFEYALRDFINVERCAAPGAVVVIDDILPNNRVQALRRRRTVAWTGDVWRLMEVLQRHRPDLFLLPIDTAPSGLLLIAGLDHSNRTLEENYAALTAEPAPNPIPPRYILERRGVISSEQVLRRVLAVLKETRRCGVLPLQAVERLREAASGSRDHMPEGTELRE